MGLEETVNTAIKSAMLARDEARLRGLRAIKAGIIVAKTEKGGSGTLDEPAEQKLLQKLAKQRKESIEIYKAQGREDLARPEEEELTVIDSFLPKQMSPEEIKAELAGIIAKVGASGPGDLGKAMGMASKHFAGKADNRLVSQFLKEMLSS